MNVSLIIALIIIVLIILYMVGNFFLNRRAVTELDQNEFHKGLRKAQVIDVREKLIMIMVILMVLAIFQYLCLDKDFKVYVKDQPVYLCDANGIASYRAARILKKWI